MLGNLEPGTRGILVACVVLFLLQQVLDGPLAAWFALWPLGPLFAPWQVVSYAFLHGGLTHILFNMIGLVTFGNELERYWGTRRFLAFYFASVVAAALAQLFVTRSLGQDVPTVGASGGIYGLLLGFAMMFPQRRIVPLIPPIPMPAWLFALLFAALELYLGVTGTRSGIAHFAHLGGMVGGFLVMRYWRSSRR
ncbi:MAG: rhomboid family intramembrane serine protease [Steroidobacteraceae bacterium]|jgi:membrane associated rhomboid family serine protease|nr:rhomboid family intramembrane serine protease [Steroidobacteraceae bacterium]